MAVSEWHLNEQRQMLLGLVRELGLRIDRLDDRVRKLEQLPTNLEQLQQSRQRFFEDAEASSLAHKQLELLLGDPSSLSHPSWRK